MDMQRKLDEVNALLEKGIPTLGLIFGVVRMLREQFKRRESDQPELTFREQIEIIHSSGVALEQNADAWFAANPGYDPNTGSRLDS